MLENKNSGLESERRRTLLQYAALAGGAGVAIPGAASGKKNQTESTRTSDTDGMIQISDFESGTDGWKTDGGNELSQISSDQYPVGVANGDHALSVDVRGDTFPAIRKDAGIQNVDFRTHPYLHAHVVGLANGSESDLAFKLRLHHKPSRGTGGKDTKSNGKKSTGNGKGRGTTQHVVELGPKTLSQLRPTEFQWNLTDVSDEKLASIRRVEIAWYLADHPPDRGPRGRNKDTVEFEGLLLFDDVRAFQTDTVSDEQKQVQKKRALHRAHGKIVDREVTEITESVEKGTFTYADGTTIAYEYETLATGYQYTIAGETFTHEGHEQ